MSIVTIPCRDGRAVSFDVVGVKADRVFLADLHARWNGYAAVVDAASEVVGYCSSTYGVTSVICTDVRGDWQEIIADKDSVVIAPYEGKVPFMVELRNLTAPREFPGGSV